MFNYEQCFLFRVWVTQPILFQNIDLTGRITRRKVFEKSLELYYS